MSEEMNKSKHTRKLIWDSDTWHKEYFKIRAIGFKGAFYYFLFYFFKGFLEKGG